MNEIQSYVPPKVTECEKKLLCQPCDTSKKVLNRYFQKNLNFFWRENLKN